MPFSVRIENTGELHYCPINGSMIDWTPKYPVTLHFAGHTTSETFGSPHSKYKKLSVPRNVQDIVQLTDEQFVALKSGGKRTPTKRRPGDPPTVNTPHTITTPSKHAALGAAPNTTEYYRDDRVGTKDLVREGDVGRYKSGTDIPNLKPNLAPSSKAAHACWASCRPGARYQDSTSES